MALNLTLVGGSPMIGNPIVYAVTAATLKGEVSFHKVKLEVTASMVPSADDRVYNKENKVVLTFSSVVNSGETVQIDISSALRSAADTYVYSSVPPSAYPYITFSLKAWDEYMQNGQEAQKTAVITNAGGTAIFGSFTDLERMLSGGNKLAKSFSRKPSGCDLEVVVEGETVVVPEILNSGVSIGSLAVGPSSHVYPVTFDVSKVQTDIGISMQTLGNRDFLVLSKEEGKKRYGGDRYCFRFINSLGVMESFAVQSLATQQMVMDSEKSVISMPETFSNFSRGIYEKKNDIEKWKLSSGPLHRTWLSWFLHEFLMATHAWIKVDGNWIPCHIVGDDTVTGIDRTKSDAYCVDFTVELDIKGSPIGALVI